VTIAEDEDEWEFYACVVDNQPASIFLNLRYEHARPAADTLYWVRIHMLVPSSLGMGSAGEAEALREPEAALLAAAAQLAFVYVGRLRTAGTWELAFYSAPDRVGEIDSLARRAELGGRTVEVDSKPDPDWSYYREFLLPDAERRRWIQNRRLVFTLRQHGDVVATPRRVDHWAYFETATARDAFVQSVTRDGFALDQVLDGDSFGAQVFRTDSVELDHIHDVEMTLVELAEQHGGEYDGWETEIVKPSSS
jgi:Regulator of ribonuclease activity B/Family of unknown function (DUF695)